MGVNCYKRVFDDDEIEAEKEEVHVVSQIAWKSFPERLASFHRRLWCVVCVHFVLFCKGCLYQERILCNHGLFFN